MATMNPEPAAFTNDDFAARMSRGENEPCRELGR
jgi:hypothetical protein